MSDMYIHRSIESDFVKIKIILILFFLIFISIGFFEFKKFEKSLLRVNIYFEKTLTGNSKKKKNSFQTIEARNSSSLRSMSCSDLATSAAHCFRSLVDAATNNSHRSPSTIPLQA